ncbi:MULTISPECIES: bacterioferritin [Snodgrassella]|uniref:Bacterioferritin n=2 Tax=Snodgrassella alvi TaxID=1196083 RepID=A0ABD7Z4V3_9NEIS|nr:MULTISPECIES: bacterioferritin [Snodgrassella]KEQ00496.1 Bacterioferritin (cytochrome b1) [Snodgrassella alvi SCGC AB-598-J21]KES13380.1 Bacterioferritin (cytochrome b1) [Snodgrassella alvi SCGC AB-598-P14]AHN29611.1 Bacterioferritin [Snodgrassella alvi wkB2]MBI0068318.1 bacterioferritin [Snodgrassella sp. M0110]MBI0077810.1 bacterioferritin [Snodgrassella sp. M0118]
MEGKKVVLDCLNRLLAGELAARDQYFAHSRMYEDMGYMKLFQRIDHEMQEETDHAHQFIHRILMLNGKPEMVPDAINVGTDVISMLENDLATELCVRQNLKDAIKLCEQEQDYVTRQFLVTQLKDTEEDHAHWLEQQLRQIEIMGLPNYLQSQL